MAHILYLTPAEKALLEKLPATLREGCEVTKETITAYETPEQLRERQDLLSGKDREFAILVKKMNALKADPSPEELGKMMESLPRHFLLTILYTMGAGFLRDCLLSALSQPAAGGIEGIATLSQLRHTLLESNLEE